MPLALFALTLAAFAIGTTEFVIVGLIPTIAMDLGVSLPSAGLLVSLYALGVAVGAPILTALTGRVPRKPLLVGLMALFTVGNVVAWLAPGYATLIVARLLTGLAHGVFFSVGSIVATSLVPRENLWMVFATGASSGTTDPTGRFRVEGVRPGKYGVVASAVTAFFYARVILLMYFQQPSPDGPTVAVPSGYTAAAIALGVAVTVVLGIVPQPLLDLADKAALFVR